MNIFMTIIYEFYFLVTISFCTSLTNKVNQETYYWVIFD